jgi:hypothetical protein
MRSGAVQLVLGWLLLIAGTDALVVELPSKTAMAGKPDPVVGRWISLEPLGDRSSYGFELKPGGAAMAINTATMRVEHWRRIDAAHIELTEVSEGNHITTRAKVRYRVSFVSGGTLTLKPERGSSRGMYVGTFRPERSTR